MEAPPKISGTSDSRVSISRANYWFGGAVISAAMAGALAVLFFFNPGQYHFYPTCQFHRLTGWNCPGCGMTRALYALLHGDLRTALRDNALLVIGLPLLLARSLWVGWQWQRGRPIEGWVSGRWLWPMLIIAVVFAVLRNLPAFSFLSPV